MFVMVYLPARYASSASVTWLVCSAWEFTETRVTTLYNMTEYFFQCTLWCLRGPKAGARAINVPHNYGLGSSIL